MVVEAVEKYAGLTITVLLAMLKAESGLNRTAARYGKWPDISFGYAQIIVLTAASNGIGNGENTPENIAAVRDALFDRTTTIDVGAGILSACMIDAANAGYTGVGQELQALIAFNSGAYQPEGNWYWRQWAGNIANYQAALDWARALIN